jgi:hypothetical protein
VIVVFAVLFALAAKVGLVGIPLAFILTSWFFKYAYILFDHTVWGIDEPPTLDIEMVNPINEQRPLAQVAILGLIYAAVKFAEMRVNLAVAIALAAIAALLFPASVAVLGLERNILKAVYPVALARMVRGLGMMYLVVLAVIACYLIGIGMLLKWAPWLPLQFGIAMFGILSVFSMLGGALYERRDELGLDTRKSPERTAELQHQADVRESEALLAEAYGQMRVGSHSKAWALLQEWLHSRGNLVADYRWLCARVTDWSDSRYANRLTAGYVERLLTLKQNGEALDAVAQRLAVDPGFRPKTAAATLHIAQLAAHGGGATRVARTLLADFGERFANDPSVAAANALAKQIAD